MHRQPVRAIHFFRRYHQPVRAIRLPRRIQDQAGWEGTGRSPGPRPGHGDRNPATILRSLQDKLSGSATVWLVVTTPADAARCQRSDARENRDRILAAAAQAFADEGLSVSLIEIARRAGVGNATLHRNFTKEQLIDELFQDWYGRRQAVAEAALADPDPWHGLVSFLEDVLADGTRNRAIGALLAVCPGWRERFRDLMTGLLARAQDSGLARGDLTVADVTLALLGVARTMAIT